MAGINLGPDHALAVRLQEMEDNIKALSTRDVLQNASIGRNGLTVNNGGSITIVGGGSLTIGPGGMLNVAAGGLNSAGSISAVTTVTAGTDLDAGGNVNVNGNVNVTGLIKSPATYSNPITTSYRSVWVTSVDGQFGYNLSSREVKMDIEDFHIDAALALRLRVVTFRYIAAVERHGEDAALEVGLIAEEVDELGLHWLVDYDPETGKPAGIKFHLLALAALAVAHDHEERLQRLESKA